MITAASLSRPDGPSRSSISAASSFGSACNRDPWNSKEGASKYQLYCRRALWTDTLRRSRFPNFVKPASLSATLRERARVARAIPSRRRLVIDRIDPVVRIEVVRADPSLALPAYAREGDAGLDLAAASAVTLPPAGRQLRADRAARGDPRWLRGAGAAAIGAGASRRRDRAERARPHRLGVSRRDRVLLVNHGTEAVTIGRGERIAQLVIQPVARASLVEVRELGREPTRNRRLRLDRRRRGRSTFRHFPGASDRHQENIGMRA